LWAILRLLLAHPLLSDEELAALLDLQRRSVRHRLYELHRLRCLEPVPTMLGKRWHLRERGLRLIAAANHVHIHTLATMPVGVTSLDTLPYVQRGEAWLLQHIQHTAGVYAFFASLARAAKEHPQQVLRWWETGATCERRYRVGEQWYNLRPDALAEYGVGQREIRFWLEWDRGTMNARDLATKFASYAQYLDSREWARERSPLPWLLFVTPEIAQERRVQRAAQSALLHLPGWAFWTTTEELLSERGPLAPIWSPGLQAHGPLPSPGGSLRQHVFRQ
jgi:Replication-relaxation